MQNGEMICGFQVLYSQALPEIGATMWRMEHAKTGAQLIWLDRPDDNKTFAITFKTIPQDDTGVFHILEHSVLNGSQKYPVKEPFVELLKSSMATFLNAMTFPDKTMYPVSSRNDQDFLNLIDVYMDAVLHPLSISDPHGFLQEGWHYELDSPEGALRCNGVVYNEMKGAFASPDSVLTCALGEALFPDNCYGYESGGHPDHIPELTYENYLASHARFYHPSNSYIFLDGQMALETVLGKINGFLADYERIDPDADIPLQAPVAPGESTCYYEIGPEEDETNKAILAAGWVFGIFSELEKSMAFSVLTSALCDSNESPLTKALLDAGLCEDVSFESMDGIQQLYAMLVIRNADPANKERIWATVEKTLRDLAEKGLDHTQLHSILNRLEFVTREKDFGTMPRGLVYAISAMTTWLYGGDPAENFRFDAMFASLREKIDAGWFEGFLRQTLLDNPHTARVCMLPSKTLGAEKRQAEAERLAAVKAGWDKDRIEAVLAQFAALRARQEAPEPAEALACLPVLSVKDIPEKGMRISQKVDTLEGVTVLHQPIETDGILYLDLHFSLADLPVEELQKVKLLTELLSQVATEHYSVLELHSQVEGSLGRFSAATTVCAMPDQLTQATPYLTIGLSMLSDRKQDAVRLLDEILNRSRFDDTSYIYNILRQERIGMEQAIIMRGNSYGAMRVSAQCSARGAVSEALGGISMLRMLQGAEKDFDRSGTELCRELARLCGTLFTKERLVMSITGPRDDGFLADVLAVLGSAPMGAPAAYAPLPTRKEGFLIPADIGFAAEAANTNSLKAGFSGTGLVAGQLLTFDYLWSEVRVKGGAYGVGLSVRPTGDVSFTSFRDPSPAKSLDTFARSGQALRAVCAGGDIEKYIVSTVATTEPVLSPRMEGNQAANLWLNGQGQEDLDRQRREILRTTPGQLAAVAETLERVCAAGHVCVIGGQTALDACQDLDCIEPLQ